MRSKRKSKGLPVVQLCLFSETEMSAMVEHISPIKGVNVFTADPGRMRWEIEIAQSLRGKEGRRHMRLLTQRKKPVKRDLLRILVNLFYDS